MAMSTDQQALYDILKMIPLRERIGVKDQILRLKDLVGDVETDYFVDFRGSHWARKRTIDLGYKVTWRNEDSECICTFEEALKFVNKTKKQLQVMLSINNGKAYFTINDDIVTVTKLS